MLRSFFLCCCMLLLLSIDGIASSGGRTELTTEELKRRQDIAAAIQQRYSHIKVVDVGPSPISGIYEIYTGDQIVYVDASGDFLLAGALIDTRSKRNLSEERLDLRSSIDYSKLPFERAIKVVKGDGSRQLAVFSDPDCPYCQHFEQQLKNVDNVTIYNFLYPIADLHPYAEEKSRLIWCAEDRSRAWLDWMQRQALPTARDCAGDPVTELRSLGNTLKVNSTPTIFFPNGRRFAGTLPAAQLKSLLEQTQSDGD